jgi:tRNA-dihydrouridine synthase B
MLAPMAGVADDPFRAICFRYGAGLVVSEMLSSNPKVRSSTKSKQRMTYSQKTGIRSVQIAGSEPILMAQAAQFNVRQGAQIIDINMGCPAKKVNKKLAGSALLPHPKRVSDILQAVITAVDVPVTLKIRTGWDNENRNGLQIAKIAENCGIQSLVVHGRTRACLFNGNAEYDTIAEIKQGVSIPVIANGDITDPLKAKWVLDYTGVDGLMIGRGAQGRPWLFQQIDHYLHTGQLLPAPPLPEFKQLVIEHVSAMHRFYGDIAGSRIARKHVGWYLQSCKQIQHFRQHFNTVDNANQQLEALEKFFDLQHSQQIDMLVNHAA